MLQPVTGLLPGSQPPAISLVRMLVRAALGARTLTCWQPPHRCCWWSASLHRPGCRPTRAAPRWRPLLAAQGAEHRKSPSVAGTCTRSVLRCRGTCTHQHVSCQQRQAQRQQPACSPGVPAGACQAANRRPRLPPVKLPLGPLGLSARAPSSCCMLLLLLPPLAAGELLLLLLAVLAWAATAADSPVDELLAVRNAGAPAGLLPTLPPLRSATS